MDYSHGAVTSVSPTNTGGGVGKVKPQPFVFVKKVDKASHFPQNPDGSLASPITTGFDDVKDKVL